MLADAGYGLSARGLAWAVGIPRHQKVCPADVGLIFPVAGRGRPRKRHIPDVLSAPAETVLAAARRRRISWRRGTKGKLSARFAALRIRVANGPLQRIRNGGAQHMPGEGAWLAGEHRPSGERKYHLSNLPAGTDLKTLAAAIKARWVCEQAHQQLKEELGLDHFEGRSWTGLHRHAHMAMVAMRSCSTDVSMRPGRGKSRCGGPPPQPSLPAIRHAITEHLLRMHMPAAPARCPHCRGWLAPPRNHQVPK